MQFRVIRMMYHTWSDLFLEDPADCLWRMDWAGTKSKEEKPLEGLPINPTEPKILCFRVVVVENMRHWYLRYTTELWVNLLLDLNVKCRRRVKEVKDEFLAWAIRRFWSHSFIGAGGGGLGPGSTNWMSVSPQNSYLKPNPQCDGYLVMGL